MRGGVERKSGEVGKPWMLRMLPDSALHSVNSSLQCHCSIAFIISFLSIPWNRKKNRCLNTLQASIVVKQNTLYKGSSRVVACQDTVNSFFPVPCIS